jgi:hypothetical protein
MQKLFHIWTAMVKHIWPVQLEKYGSNDLSIPTLNMDEIMWIHNNLFELQHLVRVWYLTDTASEYDPHTTYSRKIT